MHPFVRSRKFWLAAVAAATLIGLAEAAQLYAGAAAGGRAVSFARAASATMPSWFVLVLLMPAVFAAAHRFPLERGRWGRALAVHVPASMAYAVISLVITSWLSDYVFNPDPFPLTFGRNLMRLLGIYFILGITYYWALIGAYYAVEYKRKYHDRERAASALAVKASRLEASLVKANLDALRMQLNPHFLFNTLNAVSVLALKGERQNVVRMLTRLSDLLRISLENSEQVVSLRDELEFLQPYLEIEQVRFRDRLQVVQTVEPQALDAEVPTLLLQPLVENAVRHGVAQRTGPGLVEIRAHRSHERLVLEIADSGPGFPSDFEGIRTGVGLANVRARLEQLYGDGHEMHLTSSAAGALVTISIPFRVYDGDQPAEHEARSA